jgi:hypothetical protein
MSENRISGLFAVCIKIFKDTRISEQREHFKNVDVQKTVRVAAEACSAFS